MHRLPVNLQRGYPGQRVVKNQKRHHGPEQDIEKSVQKIIGVVDHVQAQGVKLVTILKRIGFQIEQGMGGPPLIQWVFRGIHDIAQDARGEFWKQQTA